jgi:hypothetical protein
LQVVPTADGTVTATWTPPATTATLTYQATACVNSVCGTPLSTSIPTATFSALPVSASVYVQVRSVNQVGSKSGATNSAPINVLFRPTSPTPQKLRFNSSTNVLTIDWSSPTIFAPSTLVEMPYSVETSTQTINGLLPTSSGSITVQLANVGDWIDVTMSSVSNAPSAFNRSLPTTIRLDLRRAAASQTAASPTNVPRGPASQSSPGTTVPRPAAPQS